MIHGKGGRGTHAANPGDEDEDDAGPGPVDEEHVRPRLGGVAEGEEEEVEERAVESGGWPTRRARGRGRRVYVFLTTHGHISGWGSEGDVREK